MPYNAGDSTSKSKNLFGRVEEERDNDGLRYFEYDWRGLVTKVSHRNRSSWPLLRGPVHRANGLPYVVS